MRSLTNPLRASEADLGPLFPGVYAGHVTDVGDPDKLGRIKLSVPAVFGDDSPQYDAWARPCQPYGHFMIPATGDRVWVAFEDGDPAAPVWLGCWYADGHAPADAANASPPVKRLVISESGHKLLLDDTSGSELLRLEDQSGSFVELSSTHLKLQFKDGPSLELSASGVTLDASGTAITIKGTSVDVQQA
jgi:uncharacterized protein involved in type VI secretion and phage assembly